MAPRREFTKVTKRKALARSGGLCEAIGIWYGLEAGKRCNSPLSAGVEFDHIILDANSKDNSLENCAAVCARCHSRKTRKHDTPTAAKTLRQQDRDKGISRPAGNLKGPGFPKAPKAPAKPSLPPRILFRGDLWRAGQNTEGD